jgi:hypothetical protein
MQAPRALPLCAGLLIGIFVVQSFSASRNKSAVFDEPTDIAAALSYIRTGQIRANLQHPPLIKELAGLSLWLAGVRLPDNPQVEEMLAGHGGESKVGSALIAQDGPDRVLAPARLPPILLSGILGLLLYLWGRQMVGEIAALAAVFLYALDPTLLAHSFLATMDVGLAVFTLLFFFALWNYLLRPDNQRLVWCGVALGTVLAVKFSAVFLLPVAAALLWMAVKRPPAPAAETPAGFLALYGKGKSEAGAPPVAEGYGAAACAFVIICLLAMLVVQALYFSPDGLYLYSAGIERVNADHNPNNMAYMAGRLEHHFTAYFALAYLMKEPIPNLLLAGAGLVVLLRSKAVGLMAKLFLLAPPMVLLVAHSLWADDLGIRYIIPILPFAWLIAGLGVARLVSMKSPWPRALLAVLAVWLLTTAVGIYPDHLAYFNEAACLPGHAGRIGIDGGTRCGPLWLDESNVDWGQGLKQLKEWADRNSRGRKIRLAYFGTVAPDAYGLSVEQIGLAQLITPAPGLYVVSAHWLAQASAQGADWLRTTSPAAIVGHSLYVYERR